MDDLGLGSRLFSFKTKIDEAVALVPSMTAEEKLRAVQWWNVVSEKLQEIVNDSAADINALIPQGFDEDELNSNEASNLVEAIESKSFDNFNASLSNEASLRAQSENESIDQDFPDIPSTSSGLPDSGLVSPPSTELTNLSLNLPDSGVTTQQQPAVSSRSIDGVSPGVSSVIESTANSTSLQEMKPDLSLSDNHDDASECQLADQLSTLGNESLHFSSGNVNTPIGDLGGINTDSNVLFSMEQSNGSDVTQPSAHKHHTTNCPLESQIQDSNSSPTDNLAVESENSFISESEDSSLNIDRFGVSHVSLELDTDNDSLDTLVVNQSDGNQSLMVTSISGDIDKAIEPPTSNLNPSNEANSDLEVDKQFTCNICDKVFLDAKTHSNHKCPQSKSFICNECGAKFSTKGNLLVHQRRHTGEKPFACEECPAIFSTKGNLQRHIKAHTGERSWKCEVCGSKFTEKKSLKVHMRRHTGERPYKCTVCSKTFSQTGVLQTHMALHLDERKYLCEMCGKAFRQRSQLRLHVLRHEGIKKWNCINCTAKFLTKGDLERHFRIHTGERPYICPMCGKKFTRQQSLNEHSNRHLGLKPYNCDICHKKFSEMSACYKHIKIHKKKHQKSESNTSFNLGNQDASSKSSSNDDHLVY